jgi:hypothetical protein
MARYDRGRADGLLRLPLYLERERYYEHAERHSKPHRLSCGSRDQYDWPKRESG